MDASFLKSSCALAQLASCEAPPIGSTVDTREWKCEYEYLTRLISRWLHNDHGSSRAKRTLRIVTGLEPNEGDGIVALEFGRERHGVKLFLNEFLVLAGRDADTVIPALVLVPVKTRDLGDDLASNLAKQRDVRGLHAEMRLRSDQISSRVNA